VPVAECPYEGPRAEDGAATSDVIRDSARQDGLSWPRRAYARGGHSMTLRQGLLAALPARAMIDGLEVRGAVGVLVYRGAVK